MGVCTNHHSSREGIVFQDNLVDNSSPGLPETNSVFVGYRGKEVKNLFGLLGSHFKVYFGTFFGLDKVVAVYGCRYSHFGFASVHELQECHLSGGVLTSDTIRGKIHIIFSSCKGLGRCSFPKVCIENFFSEGKGAAYDATRLIYSLRHTVVYLFYHFNIKCHTLLVLSYEFLVFSC